MPGVAVGMFWSSRAGASNCAVHCPPVAGMHGSSGRGVHSVVVSGGYAGDEDNGDDLWYTGHGGNRLEGAHTHAARPIVRLSVV